MATFYLIRHGRPDYTYGDTHGFIGQGHDFAPLKQDRIKEVIKTSKDVRLKNAQIIVASPYTRALQTASIVSVIDKYKEKYDTVIVVAHKMAFQSICDCGDMKPAEIFEITF